MFFKLLPFWKCLTTINGVKTQQLHRWFGQLICQTWPPTPHHIPKSQTIPSLQAYIWQKSIIYWTINHVSTNFRWLKAYGLFSSLTMIKLKNQKEEIIKNTLYICKWRNTCQLGIPTVWLAGAQVQHIHCTLNYLSSFPHLHHWHHYLPHYLKYHLWFHWHCLSSVS